MKRLASILIIVFAIIIFSNLVFAQNNVLPTYKVLLVVKPVYIQQWEMPDLLLHRRMGLVGIKYHPYP